MMNPNPPIFPYPEKPIPKNPNPFGDFEDEWEDDY